MTTTTSQPVDAGAVVSAEWTSSFRRIAVHVDRGAAVGHRIDLAAELAARFGAKLAGAYAFPPLSPVLGAGEIPAEFLVELEQLAESDADGAMQYYLDRVGQRGLQSEWHCLRGASISGFRHLSRYMDLCVLGQVDPEAPAGTATVRPEDIVLSSGRPVIVVPYIGCPADAGSRVVIAWDGGREAARAVGGAMPLLARAESVWVASLDLEGDAPDGGRPAEILCRYLADHAIAATPEIMHGVDVDKADALLSRISDLGANLLVMGCYGHSRLREFVLGGMTREILRHMTIPVLMAH